MPPQFGKAGYDAAAGLTSTELKRVNLPTRIKCAACERHKDQNQYSNKQLNDLRFKLRNSGSSTVGKSIRCRQCTGVQTVELYCIICSQIKALSDFALVQRKNPDTARCLACVEEIQFVAPDNRLYDADNEGNQDTAMDKDEEKDDAFDIAHALWEMDLNGEYATTDSEGGVSVKSDAGSSFAGESDVPSKDTQSGVKLTTTNLANVPGATSVKGKAMIDSSGGYTLDSDIGRASTTSGVSAWKNFAKNVDGYGTNGGEWTAITRAKKGPMVASEALSEQTEVDEHEFTAYNAHGTQYQRARAPSTVASKEDIAISRHVSTPRKASPPSKRTAFPRVRPTDQRGPIRTFFQPTEKLEMKRLENDSDSETDEE